MVTAARPSARCPRTALLRPIFPFFAAAAACLLVGRVTTPPSSPLPAAGGRHDRRDGAGAGLARRVVERRATSAQAADPEPRRRRRHGRRADRAAGHPRRRPGRRRWTGRVTSPRPRRRALRWPGSAVAGGDLSSAPGGVLMVSVTALGDLAGPGAGAAQRCPPGQTSSRLRHAGPLGRRAAPARGGRRPRPTARQAGAAYGGRAGLAAPPGAPPRLWPPGRRPRRPGRAP